MNWDAVGAIAESLGAVGVIATLAYLAFQIKGNTTALSAQSRHSLSEFVLRVAMFRAEHAAQYAKLKSGENLTPADLEFEYWSHMQIFLHAETYYHHFELGLMPKSHWSGYAHYITEYMHSNGFVDFWKDSGLGFSENFREWVSTKLEEEDLITRGENDVPQAHSKHFRSDA